MSNASPEPVSDPILNIGAVESQLSQAELEAEFDQAIFSFEDIQAELNYKQAHDALRELVKNLDLTPQEQVGLESEIRDLQSMLSKLESLVVHIAVFGMVGRGKSSLLNALLGQNILKQVQSTV